MARAQSWYSQHSTGCTTWGSTVGNLHDHLLEVVPATAAVVPVYSKLGPILSTQGLDVGRVDHHRSHTEAVCKHQVPPAAVPSTHVHWPRAGQQEWHSPPAHADHQRLTTTAMTSRCATRLVHHALDDIQQLGPLNHHLYAAFLRESAAARKITSDFRGDGVGPVPTHVSSAGSLDDDWRRRKRRVQGARCGRRLQSGARADCRCSHCATNALPSIALDLVRQGSQLSMTMRCLSRHWCDGTVRSRQIRADTQSRAARAALRQPQTIISPAPHARRT